jgi:hypothetical protein
MALFTQLPATEKLSPEEATTLPLKAPALVTEEIVRVEATPLIMAL